MKSSPILNDRLALTFLCFLISASLLENIIDGARYLKYAAAPLAIIFWITMGCKKPTQKSSAVYWFTLYTCWTTFTLIWGDLTTGPKDIIFTLSYVLPVLLFKSDNLKLETIFFIYTTLSAISIIGHQSSAFSLADSSALYESSNSFVFGGFLVAFLLKKKKFLAITSLILLFITLKRISLLGVMICFFIIVSPAYLKKALASSQAILLGNIAALLIIISTATGTTNNIIEDLTGKGIAEFSLGRNYHYIGVVSDMVANPANLIFGNGAGSAYSKAIIDPRVSENPNLHSDTLKILYECGLIFFLLFFYRSSKNQNFSQNTLLIYISILFITDNTLIYSGVMFFLLILLESMKSQTSTAKVKLAPHPKDTVRTQAP